MHGGVSVCSLYPFRTGREEIDDERKTVYCDKYCFNIFPVYNFSDTALESPAAEIIILVYIAVMIVGGIFTITAYTKGKVKNNLMKICLVVHGVYIVGGVAMLAMMGATKFS